MTAYENLCRSTQEKNVISRFGYNDYMAYHYAFMMKVAIVREPENFAEAAQDSRWVEAINKEMQVLDKNEIGIWSIIHINRKHSSADGSTK